MAPGPIVLFLSTNHAARGIMSEAILRHQTGDYFRIYSAGLEPIPISPLTLQVLDEAGIDHTGLESRDVRPLLGRLDVRYLITVSHHAEERAPSVFPGALYYTSWQLDNPETLGGTEEEKLQRYRALRDQISEKVSAWAAQHMPVGSIKTE